MIAAIVFGIALTALVSWYVVEPLLSPAEAVAEVENPPDLEERYRDALRTILDLEADYETGKLSRSDYEAAVRRMKLRAAEILREMDSPENGLTASDDTGRIEP